jgi:hypothetical protein
MPDETHFLKTLQEMRFQVDDLTKPNMVALILGCLKSEGKGTV